MNCEWESFLDDDYFRRSYIAQVGETEGPGAWTAADVQFAWLFPALDELLKNAAITPLVMNGEPYRLFSWRCRELEEEGEFCAWLSRAPSPQASVAVHEHHRVLLASFGGIVERTNEPEDTWLLSHGHALTEQLARKDATFISEFCTWLFEEAGVSIPIALNEFYAVDDEGVIRTFCHRNTGEIVVFAPDHNYHHIVPLPGCPDYTLYRIPEAPFFSNWVNAVATKWRKSILS